MASGFVIRRNEYYDSVFLMRIARMLDEEPGVDQSAAVMATDANKTLLAEIGIQGTLIDQATANDLIVAVVSTNKAVVEQILGGLENRLRRISGPARPTRFNSVDAAALSNPESNLVVISVPGEYAAREAHKALDLGKHVFLFSNNVHLEDEIELKRQAKARNLLVMGPDCGTSIINGIGIGFANVVRRGPVGVVGGSGTGLQEFTSLVHQSGSGISHAIGTGSRDLSDAVGGVMTLMGLDALDADPLTEVIAVVSKSAQPVTLRQLSNRISICKKPVIGCFLGLDVPISDVGENFTQAATIDEAVSAALMQVNIDASIPNLPESELERLIQKETSGWMSNQLFMRGLFAGGSFCYQSKKILNQSGFDIYSNNHTDKRFLLENPEISKGHTCIDLGDDFFTRGKPHPMIDSGERRKRLLLEADDHAVAIVLLDFILGHISSHDPVGDLIDAIREAKGKADQRGAHLTMVASICGTELDPQGMHEQKRMLEDAGVNVFPSNAQAAMFCSRLIHERSGRDYGA